MPAHAKHVSREEAQQMKERMEAEGKLVGPRFTPLARRGRCRKRMQSTLARNVVKQRHNQQKKRQTNRVARSSSLKDRVVY